ncbi:RNA polymerase sigma factor [Aquisphaera insulae]|uniref:RNA polymerase sigma factor n=1 Tax=Aquisphaera insulae TaxID=2712864 RepID=UPI0013EDE368|nr:sigma-70 family RNA polymerase sigma factor [Aquisphaera insulae]
MTGTEAPTESFESLIRRVREGDQVAAAELVRRYEPAIRRAARVRLVDTRLNRLLDSMDICQSVLASFFVRAAMGQYHLESPEQLLKLLATMTRNKLAGAVKGQRAQRRDFRRIEAVGGDDPGDSSAGPGIDAIPGRVPSPSREVAARDLLDAARRRLLPDELDLFEQRQEGREWAEIAAERGASPEAIRKRLARAVDRVAEELGLD